MKKGKGIPKQTEKDVREHIFDYDYKFDKDTFPYLDGSDVTRYGIDWSRKWLRYGKWLSQPKTLKQFSEPRILIREITAKFPHTLLCSYTEDVFLNNKSILNILQLNKNYDLKFLLSYLNSTLISFYHKRRTVKGSRNLFPKLVIKDLKDYPVPVVAKAQQKPFINIVERIISAKTKNPEADTSKEEKQIDLMVYHLYNLTYEDAKIIDAELSEEEFEKYKIEVA